MPNTRMRLLAATFLGLMLAAPVSAQSLNDLGKVLQDQVLGGNQQNQQRDRDAYERGRQDQAEQARRDREFRDRNNRQRADDRRNDDRRYNEDRRYNNDDRRSDDRRPQDYRYDNRQAPSRY